MKNCVECGAELADEAVFCSMCGAKQEKPVRVCCNCGEELEEGDVFCTKCGARQEDAEKDESEKNDTNGKVDTIISKEEQFEYELNDDNDGVVITGLVNNASYIYHEKKSDKSDNKKSNKNNDWGYEEYGVSNMPARRRWGAIVGMPWNSNNSVSNDPADYESDNALDKIIVPAEIEGMPVTEIGEEAFENINVKTVRLPDSITKIRASAFEDCRDLESINFPEELEVIEGSAFSNCALKEISLPDSIEEIGDSAFSCCSLKKVNFNSGIEFGEDCFYDNPLALNVRAALRNAGYDDSNDDD